MVDKGGRGFSVDTNDMLKSMSTKLELAPKVLKDTLSGVSSKLAAKVALENERQRGNKEKIDKYLKDKPFERILYDIHQKLTKKVEEKEKQIKNDPNFLEIFCSDGHLLEKTKYKPQEDMKKPKCYHCQQPHIDAHEFYYRCSDPSHDERYNHFTLCRICAYCYNTGDGIKLKKSMHIGLHEHHIHRQPIKNRNQWTCHT